MAITVRESIYLGLIDFWTRKLNSILSLLGVVLGTLTIIVILSLMGSIKDFSEKTILSSGGIDKISVSVNRSYERKSKTVRKYFTFDEINYIRDNLPLGSLINPISEMGFISSYKSNFSWVSFIGTTKNYPFVNDWNVAKGRFFSDFDYKNSTNVVILGSKVVKNLFNNKNPIGKSININRKRFKIIGVMEEKFLEGFEYDEEGNHKNVLDWMNYRAFTPLSSLNKRVYEVKIKDFDIKVLDEKQVLNVKNAINKLILNMRNNEDVFNVETVIEEKEDVEKKMMIFNVVSFLISGISLFVAGIVIMNIMMSTINERIREIGVRLATGAKSMDVFVQFLVQTVIVTTVGGIFGSIISYFIVNRLKIYLDLPLILNYKIFLSGILISSFVGLLFGILPAIRASRMDPVKALRCE